MGIELLGVLCGCGWERVLGVLFFGWGDFWVFAVFLGGVGVFCFKEWFRRRILTCFCGFLDGRRRRDTGGEKFLR